MKLYSYPRSEPRFNLRLRHTTPNWLHYAVDFPTAHPTRYEENNTARGEYFQPKRAEPAPLTILLHGMGDLSVLPCRFLARALARKGIASFILYLAFHTSRMPRDIRERLPALTSEEWLEGYQVSVTDVRQVVDWTGSRAEINREQVAAIGISLGGFISAIAMGIDKRIGAGVFLISGGNSEEITWKSRNRLIKKAANCTETECHEIHRHYAEYLAEVAEKGFDNVTPVKECFVIDPMTFASYLRRRPVLMINALWDEFIPRKATLDFWNACGNPTISWFPATHSTIWLWYPFIRRKITNFLSSTFGVQDRRSA
jgi:predicted esterase